MVKLLKRLITREVMHLETEVGDGDVCCEQGSRGKVLLLKPISKNHNKTGGIVELIIPIEELVIEEDKLYFLETENSNIQLKKYFPSDPEYKEKYLALEEVGLI